MSIRAALLILALFFVPTHTMAQQIVIGVVEEVPGVYAGESNSYGVRVVFQKSAIGWKPFPSNCPDQQCLKTISSQFPAEIHWQVAFDGKSLGDVIAHTPREFAFYSHIGLQEITSKSPVPTIGKPSIEFSGFLDQPVHRFLVAISQPNFRDPDSWKPSSLSVELLALLRQQFHRQFPKLCRISKQGQTKLEPRPYREEELQLIRAYASKTGWVVARLRLEDAVDCEDTDAGFQIEDPWFTIDPARSSRYLDSGTWLVDAGDYDNQGHSELIFSIDRYDRGGYILYYDDFKKHVIFEFSYH
jgi:hypothetical protein